MIFIRTLSLIYYSKVRNTIIILAQTNSDVESIGICQTLENHSYDECDQRIVPVGGIRGQIKDKHHRGRHPVVDMHSERLQKPLPVNTSGFTFGNAADETTEQVSHEQTYEAYDAHFL
jgi:hypothetical protein